uniref:Uncharacterized protein n=1 Tax=viral metagenome TaxID=1070528 RepID=A0A6M3KJZ1_9ZZZZ
MKFCLAGNFPQLGNFELEKLAVDQVHQMGEEYHRLGSFFYKKETETILRLKGKEEKNEIHEEGSTESI